MNRLNKNESVRAELDRLAKENVRLKLMLREQDSKNNSTKKNNIRVSKARNNKVKKKQKSFSFRTIGTILIITGLAFLVMLMYGTYKDYKRARDVKKLQEQRASAFGQDISVDTILPEYRKMYETNSDLVGWIVIDGTDINYPVVQSKVYQEFYLDHNFDGEEDEAGSIFIDARNDVSLPDDNIIIYGHNMKNGSMFGTLQHYLDKDYYEEHSIVSFDTLHKRHIYKIAAVGLSKISDESDDTFKYYDFLNAENKKSFNNYVKNIQSLEAYETGVKLEYGDKLITLSTCNSVEEDGRLFIIAKEVEDDSES